ncbi:conserved hypothetical protein [Bosea sp. 62]|uniref:hypothetical protein n=1 Tax=unclassified Bosea (in: a-proteobacteria) TaxID=2653178 RepID=UPI001255D4DB|nr:MULTISPECIES: hypothetical protein [unclassified Bosea (in: a-proteobacteria)]CAD5294729.1 conserved hypothetical protein [Bosea sp. 21B]CAD5295229.1 conserved hypothetical protein [Bosea sp. 46]CAD5298567.1 conserved hypothetical protein [Bosea sp. 7B]VVT60910.1 Phasin protein [Bosea sp. EC-HK365B]VXB36822.1 conserved hypothetical protein [Bosea sp. 127]
MTSMKSNQQPAKDAVAGLDGIARTAEAQLKVATAIPQAIIEANWAMASEFLIFASRRLQAQMYLWWSLCDCQGLSEAVAIQRQFTERVTDDYSGGVNQLSEVVRRSVISLSTVGAKLVVETGETSKLAA